MALASRTAGKCPVPTAPKMKVLNLTDFTAPTPLKHKGGKDALTIGWWVHPAAANAAAENRTPAQLVGRGCTNGVSHSIYSTTQTHSKGHGEFYATREDALKALRVRTAKFYSKSLATIDQDIRTAHNQVLRGARKRAS